MNDVTLYIASTTGWWKQQFNTIDDAHEVLMAVKRTATGSHWSICPTDDDDGGDTPPLSAKIHSINPDS